MRKIRDTIIVLMILFTASLCADHSSGRGLKAHTQEQLKYFEDHGDWVVSVKHNKMSAERLMQHLKEHGLPHLEIEVAQSNHEEVTTVKGLSSDALSQILYAPQASLPSAVDNSTLPSFPPIGDQGRIGSCVGWGSTYYQATHEVGLLNGYNNKTSNQHVLSPKWTYNLLNGGQDNGLWPSDAYSLLASNGAVSLANFPYDSNYLAWDTNAQDWVSAISYRLAPVQNVAGLGGQTQNLATIKQLLANGHVLTFATYVDSWVYTTVKKDPSNPNSPHVGEQAVSWMNGSSGGHFLTIVGYDDNVWIDINGSGQVDSGEKGAFLIANSWGSSWGNNGFIWIAYDAFRSVSAVARGPSSGRVALGDAMNNIAFSALPKATNYQPKLVANFSISQSDRSTLSVKTGVSTTGASSPSSTLTNFALKNNGGSYEFNGIPVSSTQQTVIFAYDLTDLIPSSTTAASRYYIQIADNSSSNITHLNSYTLTDFINSSSASCSQTPLTCNKSSLTAFIDYNINVTNSNNQTPDTTPPLVSITSPINGDNVSGTLQVTVNATDDVAVARVELYVDSQLYATDTTSPYNFSVDTTQLSNGSHQLTAIAYDTSNNQAQSSVQINVSNQQLYSTVFVNCGGNLLTSKNIVWSQDFGFSSPSSILSTTANFSNPIYQTARTGNFNYQFPVTNGQKRVTLKFAEIQYNSKGKRVFNVLINGNKVLSNLDIFRTAGFKKAYDRTFTINVTNNQIQISLVPVTGNAIINGIQIQ